MKNALENQVADIRKKLDRVSPCFCIAKWTSVTLHLESGQTHSCHHPKAHTIPLDELKNNPASLHNTEKKIKYREQMLKGERPKECDYCWNVEDLKTSEISDRYLKSAADWSADELDHILSHPLDRNYKPKYLEVSFSHKCQFKCMYCSADYSSAWEEDIKRGGAYPGGVAVKTVKTFNEEENPYIKAFWRWWPEIKDGLHTFRITGGEPLMSANTFKIIEDLLAQPQPKLSFAINTNLGVSDNIMKKFLTYAGRLQSESELKEFKVYTSVEAFGVCAEYVRDGLNSEKFWHNVEALLQCHDQMSLTFMCTFNALSVTSFQPLIEKVHGLNLKYMNSKRLKPVLLDISYLRQPDFQTVQILPQAYVGQIENLVNILEKFNSDILNVKKIENYYELEIIKLRRISQLLKNSAQFLKLCIARAEFYHFFTEYDKRRNKKFLETFPEMKYFWFVCGLNYMIYACSLGVAKALYYKGRYFIYKVKGFIMPSEAI